MLAHGCMCIQSTLKREEWPGLAGSSKLPLASLQFCERTCYVIPQESVFSYFTVAKNQYSQFTLSKIHALNEKNKQKNKMKTVCGETMVFCECELE